MDLREQAQQQRKPVSERGDNQCSFLFAGQQHQQHEERCQDCQAILLVY